MRIRRWHNCCFQIWCNDKTVLEEENIKVKNKQNADNRSKASATNIQICLVQSISICIDHILKQSNNKTSAAHICKKTSCTQITPNQNRTINCYTIHSHPVSDKSSFKSISTYTVSVQKIVYIGCNENEFL